MLVDHPASGLLLLAAALAVRGVPTTPIALWLASRALAIPIPDPVGVVLWQARQSALLEFLMARKFGLFGSIFCT
jgi:hypothetical protein